MRNIFDQYKQAENRLTHSLATVLHEDAALLKNFLSSFGPGGAPATNRLSVIEQSLPGRPEPAEEEASANGLPDALIYSEDGWALVIESKVGDALTRDQLRRHTRTVERCGFDRIHGLAITLNTPGFAVEGWRMITWKEVYSWASSLKAGSNWAAVLVEYFNVAEARMAGEEYLKEGTITEFSGISFDPYTYLEGKRILRLLTGKLRANASFVEEMGLDPASGRSSVTEQERLWDFLSFIPPHGQSFAFQEFPHCTVGIGPDDAEAMITFPNGMRPPLRQRLIGSSRDEFGARLHAAGDAVVEAMGSLRGYRPMARLMQRRYPSQRSVPLIDGKLEFDLRATRGDEAPQFGPRIKAQPQWVTAVYDLLSDKQSNMQFQIGVQFEYPRFNELTDRNADQHFVAAFKALLPFAAPVISG